MVLIRLILGNLLIFGFFVVVIEGVASSVLLFREISTTQSVAERQHTQYDAELGWVNKPRVYLPNMYGPGVHFRTNVQGYRNNYDVETVVPQDKYRIVCSGDSFTLGYGVDNDHAWCQVLTLLDPRLETVNMGQGGYGVDQAYLWYRRDAAKYDHQMHLFGFITNDFYRMQSDTFLGYGKPRIALEGDMLVVKNVPVPRHYSLPWFTSNSENLKRLRIVELFEKVSKKFRSMPDNKSDISREMKNQSTRAIARKIFQDLKRISEERSGQLVLLYLPTLDDLKDDDAKEWMEWLERESRDLGVPVINVLGEFRSLPFGEITKMFIPEGQINYRGAAGHLNERGNEFVAKFVYQALKKQPALSKRLSLE